ncbi:hypothetical protein [Alteribacillus sp. YIM 98480]|nr:hypothetical protein [Alteribacillus sp. YIM 98480]
MEKEIIVVERMPKKMIIETENAIIVGGSDDEREHCKEREKVLHRR